MVDESRGVPTAVPPDVHAAGRLAKYERRRRALLPKLAKDDMDSQDAMNILRAGTWDAPEWEKGAWRYRVRTFKMTVIIEIDFENREFTVVTGWRN